MTLNTTPIDILHRWQNELARAQGYQSFDILAAAAITDARAARLFDGIQNELRDRARAA